MKQSNISTVIASVGSYLPERVVTNEEIEEKVGFGKLWRTGLIKSFSGVEERRYAAENEQASDLAAAAGLKALKKAGMDPKDLDIVIFSAASQDVSEPATSTIVQHKLGAVNSHTFDVKNACNATINAVDIAHNYIQNGSARNILVCSGEIPSRFIKWDIKDRRELQARFAAFTLGDAGGSFLLTAKENEPRGIYKTRFKTLGDNWQLCVVWGGGTVYPHDPEKMYFAAQSQELIGLAMETTPSYCLKMVEETGWEIKDIDFAATHQVAKMINVEIMKRFNFPEEKTHMSLVKCGNNAAASLPVVMEQAEELGKVKRGDKVVLVGGASGFSIAYVAVVW